MAAVAAGELHLWETMWLDGFTIVPDGWYLSDEPQLPASGFVHLMIRLAKQGKLSLTLNFRLLPRYPELSQLIVSVSRAALPEENTLRLNQWLHDHNLDDAEAPVQQG